MYALRSTAYILLHTPPRLNHVVVMNGARGGGGGRGPPVLKMTCWCFSHVDARICVSVGTYSVPLSDRQRCGLVHCMVYSFYTGVYEGREKSCRLCRLVPKGSRIHLPGLNPQ